jgi:hypothetical protein
MSSFVVKNLGYLINCPGLGIVMPGADSSSEGIKKSIIVILLLAQSEDCIE